MRLAECSPQPEAIRDRRQKRDTKGNTQEHRTGGEQNRRAVVLIVQSKLWHGSHSFVQTRSSSELRLDVYSGADGLRSPLLLDEAADELPNLIRCRIESEMTCIEDVDFGFRHVPA